MKKFLPLVPVLALLFVTGCGSDDNIVKIGTIKYLNVTEENLDEILGEAHGRRKHIFFENLSAMTQALQAGQIDEMSIYQNVALYLNANDSAHHWEISAPVVSDFFCCAFREEDVELRDEFNAAILTLTKDGTLSRLVTFYIDESVHGMNSPAAVELPTFYGAPTIKIGVTGDLPLLDYIRADGVPAGFNTALLAEISRLIGKNFVLVQIEGGARAIALSSKQIDVIFWVLAPQKNSIVPVNFDKPDGMIFTVPYFSDDIVHVKPKK